MATSTTRTNKPILPRGNDQSPLAYNRAKLFSGKALSFDGVNDSVFLSDFTLTGNTASISFYLNWDDLGTDAVQFICEGNDPLDLLIHTGGTSGVNGFRFAMTSGATFDSTGVIQNGYNYYTFTTDGTTANVYVNGVLFNSETINLGSVSITEIGIGNRQLNNTLFLDGQIAGFKIFNTALTAAQVADLYNNPEKVVPTGVDNTALKLWLPMQEGAGTTAYDGSGNGNHGTISGATYVHGIGAPVAQTAVIDWNKSHNYIDKSEEFETASWSENRLVTITDDSFIAPDGSATATEIVETTANDSHFLAQTLSVTAGDYFISAYVKKRDYDWVQLSTGGDTSRYANFNISTGATGNASDITELIIEDAGNGWYRIGGKLTTSSTSFNYFITLIQSDVASRFQTYTGTDKGQYIWGAQATKSATLQPYLRNIGTSEITADVLLPQGLTTGRDITGVNLFENVRKQGALNLDGNSWAEVHDNASVDLTTGLTLEAWVYFEGISQSGLLGKWGSTTGVDRCYLLMTGADGKVRFYTNTDAGIDSTALSIGWNHIVGTYDKTTSIRKLYVNAVEKDSDAFSADLVVSDKPVEIGRYNYGTLYQHPGQIAQPRIYNRALTAEEVARNYNNAKSIYTNS